MYSGNLTNPAYYLPPPGFAAFDGFPCRLLESTLRNPGRCLLGPARLTCEDKELASAFYFQGLAGGQSYTAYIYTQLQQPVPQSSLTHAQLIGGSRQPALVNHFWKKTLQWALVLIFHSKH
jgi:hypothetical protein